MGRELALDLSRRNIHVSGNKVVGEFRAEQEALRKGYGRKELRPLN